MSQSGQCSQGTEPTDIDVCASDAEPDTAANTGRPVAKEARQPISAASILTRFTIIRYHPPAHIATHETVTIRRGGASLVDDLLADGFATIAPP